MASAGWRHSGSRSYQTDQLFSRTTKAAAGDAPPRDVESMKEEIAELQAGTTASLDRAIAAAEATNSVANHTNIQLAEQRHQMGKIEAEARGIDSRLRRTGYNLRYGLTWRGALTSPFRRNEPEAKNISTKHDISPVFKDDYSDPTAAPRHGGSSSKSDGRGGSISPKTKKGGLFKGRATGEKAARPRAEPPMIPDHVPDGFENQLDKLDGLLDGLNQQAQQIGAELKQQNAGIDALGGVVEPLRQETASQAKQIKRRFGVRG